MRTINPYMAAANRQGMLDGHADDAALRARRWLRRSAERMSGLRHFRLYSGDMPCGAFVCCTELAAQEWNRNARAFFAWQASLGRELISLLLFKEEAIGGSKCWIVKWRLNNREQEPMLLVANTAAQARKEFNDVANVCAQIISVEETEDYELAVAMATDQAPPPMCEEKGAPSA